MDEPLGTLARLKPRILVIAPDTLVAHGLLSIIAGDAGYELMASVSPGAGNMEDASKDADCVVVALGGETSRYEIGPQIRSVCKRVVSVNSSASVMAILPGECMCPHFVADLVRRGVSCCLDWMTSPHEFLKGLHEASSGRMYHCQAATDLLKEYHVRRTSKELNVATRELSDRECEVAALLLRLMSSSEVAKDLCISIRTVQTHRRRIYFKTGVRSLLELERWWRTMRGANDRGGE